MKHGSVISMLLKGLKNWVKQISAESLHKSQSAEADHEKAHCQVVAHRFTLDWTLKEALDRAIVAR